MRRRRLTNLLARLRDSLLLDVWIVVVVEVFPALLWGAIHSLTCLVEEARGYLNPVLLSLLPGDRSIIQHGEGGKVIFLGVTAR